MSGATLDPRFGAPRAAPKRGLEFKWSDPRLRAIVYQVLIIGALVLLLWFFISNAQRHMAEQNIRTGFAFLDQNASYQLAEKLIPFDGSVNSYGRAIVVGILNTLEVSILGIVLTTVLGTLIGIGRLSKNFLIAKLTAIYVEVIRDIPVLLQLFFWALILKSTLPGLDQYKQALQAGHVPFAWNPLPGVSLTQRGLRLPALEWAPAHSAALLALLVAIAATVWYLRLARRRQDATGVAPRVWPVVLGLLLGVPLIVWAVMGAPFTLDMPTLGTSRFGQFVGGVNLSPEFFALLFGLVLYTAAYIAEIVRSGIQAVPKGQWEAAEAIGLSTGQVLRRVVLPQALRVIVPPMTSQYLNLTKNTSLALAIGYADLMAVASTTLNITGQSPEVIAIAMAVYLSISLSISVFMNWYNGRIALVER